MKRSLGLLLALVTTAGASQSQADDSPRQIAESAAAQWNKAFADGKVDEILALYTDNAILMQPNGKVSRGSGQIRAFWQNLIDQGEFAMDVVDSRHSGEGTIVTTAKLSDVKILPTPEPQVMKYRFGGVLQIVLRRQPDGSWKSQVQRWNSDRKT
jgi:ketosteroid isomerase-like protein